MLLENNFEELMKESVEVKSANSRLVSKIDTLSKRALTKEALIEDDKKVPDYHHFWF